MKYLLLLFCLTSTTSFSQQVKFREIKRRAKGSIVYPIVITKSKTISKLINDQIKEAFFAPDDKKISVEKLLDNSIAENLTNLSYEVTFKGKGVLSLNLFQEGCGAYCSSWYTYFNFDLNTGKSMTIENLIREDRLDSFKSLVFRDKINYLEEYKKEEKGYLKNNEIDSSIYNWTMEQVENYCINEAHISVFLLSDQYLKIIDPCELPHAIQSQTPVYDLKYSYAFLKPFLKAAFLRKLK